MKVIIIGSSGHAKVVIDALIKCGNYSIVGLVDDFRGLNEETLCIPVIGKVSDVPILEANKYNWIIAVGDNLARFQIYNKLLELKLNYINVIHPSAIIGMNVTLGVGNFIAAGAIINSGTTIKDHCIVNTGAQLDHDNELQSFASVAPNAATGGNVTIGQGSHLGIGSCVKEKVSIGRQTVIGAGSVVLNNIGKFRVAYGVPCKEIRLREMRETFL